MQTNTSHYLALVSVTVLLCTASVSAANYENVDEAAADLLDKSRSVRKRAYSALRDMGVEGRLAMLEAIRTGEETTNRTIPASMRNSYDRPTIGDELLRYLLSWLHRDKRKERNIEPVIRAALKGMDTPGPGGARCAGVASAGWGLGLLDDEAKIRIVQLCYGVNLEGRDEYPTGKAELRLEITERMVSSDIRFKAIVRTPLDGEYDKKLRTKERLRTYWPRRRVSYVDATELKPGEHVAWAEATVILYKSRQFGPDVEDDTGWSWELESDPIRFRIVQEMDDELKAEVTPELQQKVNETLLVEPYKRSTSRRSNFWETDRIRSVNVKEETPPVLTAINPPPPVDLAYRSYWMIQGQDKTYVGSKIVLPQNTPARLLVRTPMELLEQATEPGRHRYTAEIVLIPSFEAALCHPEVNAYWPLPLNVPDTTIEVNVSFRER